MGLHIAAVILLVLAWAGFAAPVAAEPAKVVVRNMLSSTAQLVVEREGGGRRMGSSVVLAKDVPLGKTILVTAAHVLAPIVPQKIHVVTPLRKAEFPAEVLALDLKADLAILEVANMDIEPVTLAALGNLGDQVWVTAFPWGGRVSLVGGMVSQINWRLTEAATEVPLSGPVSLIDASVRQGMSGGGVFDRESGALLGIVRGYRTMTMTLPGERNEPISLPVGGETTVVSTLRILCFVSGAGYRHLVPAGLQALLTKEACGADE